MAGPVASRKRRGTRGPCTYCNKRHRKGKKGNSCYGHSVRAMSPNELKAESDAPVYRSEPGRPTSHPRRVARIERAAQRNKHKRSPEEQLQVLNSRPGAASRERAKLQALMGESDSE